MSSAFGSFSGSAFGRRSRNPRHAPPVDRRPRLQGVPVDDLPEVLPETKRGRRRRITVIGEEVLHQPCREVTDFGSRELRTLIDDMFATMEVASGVGLAANQVGVDLRVFVYDCPDMYDIRNVGHICNPRVVEASSSEGRVVIDEGCLSVPGAAAELARPTYAVVEGVDQRGNPLRLEGAGLFARCLLHESDHLDGKLYVDRLSSRERKAALREMDEVADETWAAWDERARQLGKS